MKLEPCAFATEFLFVMSWERIDIGCEGGVAKICIQK